MMNREKLAEPSAAPVNWKQLKTQSTLSDFFGNAFALIIPTLTFLEVELVGRLFLSEILIVCMLPILLYARGGLLLSPLPKKLLLFGLAWLSAQIATDIIIDTPIEDLIRGWAKIIFLLINFSAIYLYLNRNKMRFFLFALGIALGQILAYFFNPNIYVESYPWKFGYGMAVTLLFVLISQTRVLEKKILFISNIILSMGLLNFYMDFRSLGLICLLTGGFIFIKDSALFSYQNIKRNRIINLIVLGSVSIYSISTFYNYSASEGWLGEEIREKNLLQSSGDMGLLLGGRAEILASSQAVIDSPIIGHGSWAKDQKYADMLEYALSQYGYDITGTVESDLIPTHSYIMGAWVEAGIVGAAFWLYALILTVRCLVATYQSNLPLLPLTVFIAFNLLWNIPFSPFGAEVRLYAAYDLSLMIFILSLQNYSGAKLRT